MTYMPEDKAQVGAWVQDKAKVLAEHFRARNEMWSFDRALLYQVYKAPIPDFPNIHSAEPRSKPRRALDGMTMREPRIHILIHDQEADEQDRMNKGERCAVGLLREADR